MVVFPFVPVMPTTRMRRLGWPKNADAASARASRPSLTVAHGTGHPGGGSASATTAIAPLDMAWPANLDPSACNPRSATNTEPGAAARES